MKKIASMPTGFHGKFSILVSGERHTWFIQSLVKVTEKLPLVDIKLSKLDHYLDENVWFNENKEPTVRAVIQHYKRINEADLAFPIIISPEIGVLDGLHRIAKAQVLGKSTIKAVILENLPAPDYIGIIT